MQRREDAKKEVPLLVAQGKEFPINSLLPFTSQGRRSDRLGERQVSRFENLKVFEFDIMLLGGSAPKPPGFFEA